MAIIDATSFKAAIATAAADLTTAWTDDTVTRTAIEIQNPHHPLRQLERLFLFNSSTGVVTADDAYIDAAYAGEYPQKAQQFQEFTDWQTLTLLSATVEDLAPTDIVLTFNRDVANGKNIFLGGDADPAKAITGIAIVDAVVTITVGVAYVFGDVITASGEFRTSDSAELLLSGEAVTNNVLA